MVGAGGTRIPAPLNKPEPPLPFLGGADTPLLGSSKIRVANGWEGGQELYFGVSFLVPFCKAYLVVVRAVAALAGYFWFRPL